MQKKCLIVCVCVHLYSASKNGVVRYLKMKSKLCTQLLYKIGGIENGKQGGDRKKIMKCFCNVEHYEKKAFSSNESLFILLLRLLIFIFSSSSLNHFAIYYVIFLLYFVVICL